MGRLIDIDVLFDYFGNDAINETTRSNIEYFVSEKGTVEAIPKADYEARLKADMVVMLTDIQLKVEEIKTQSGFDESWDGAVKECSKVIKQKINELKGEQEK